MMAIGTLRISESGGYPKSLFIDAVSDDLTCPICLDVVNDPKECCNGHIFCAYCIYKSLSYKTGCPLCRSSETVTSLSPNYFVLNLINAFQVKCIHFPTCTWKGELRSLPSHLFEECHSVRVPCPHLGCKRIVSRKNLSYHMIHCLYMYTSCRYCPHILHNTSCEINQHQVVCPYKLMPCPNTPCSMLLSSHELLSHLNTCPYKLVTCPFKQKNSKKRVCNGRCYKRDLQTHINDHLSQQLIWTPTQKKIILERDILKMNQAVGSCSLESLHANIKPKKNRMEERREDKKIMMYSARNKSRS
mmetsp:Transcript_38639/g.39335  ORF Transcript_38639/g.39335 Transcript_38639/m.39335 type:complete len:302 (+) Transcript_38639:18-923(+)